MEIISLVTGLLIGAIGAGATVYLFHQSKNVEKRTFDNLLSKYNESVAAREQVIVELTTQVTKLAATFTDDLNRFKIKMDENCGKIVEQMEETNKMIEEKVLKKGNWGEKFFEKLLEQEKK
jgi:gas vesicle protein